MPDLKHAGPAGLNLLTATVAAQKIAAGEITSEALVRDCLERIEARDVDFHAWTFLDSDLALAQSRACDNEAPRGHLHGVPIGVKDILDTADMPTEYGSKLYAGNQPESDCATVATLRRAGAVIIGKTVTTEFASPYPTHTLNPHDLKSTPGVSSSGSAAAIADYMIPLSNGTQTGGSVIRPAALCGVYGYKASHDNLDPTGIPMWKSSIDTLGHFARSLTDIALMRAALMDDRPASLNLPKDFTPRIGICRTKLWPEAGAENVAMIDKVSAILRDAGAHVDDVSFPTNFDEINQAHPIITGADSISVLPDKITSQLENVNPWTRDRTRDAKKRSDAEVEEARSIAAHTRVDLKQVFEDFDLLLTPAAEGEAQMDLVAMPPPSFNSLWTLMHTPCLSLPAFKGPNDMPVGLQIVGVQGRDNFLLALSAWMEKKIINAIGGLPASL